MLSNCTKHSPDCCLHTGAPDWDFVQSDTKECRDSQPHPKGWMCRLLGNSSCTIAGRRAAAGPSLCSFSAVCQTDWSFLHPTPRDPLTPGRVEEKERGGSVVYPYINKPGWTTISCPDIFLHSLWCSSWSGDNYSCSVGKCVYFSPFCLMTGLFSFTVHH